jgi:hypothetical protein
MKTQDFIRESAEKYEYDDEVGMVKNNLHTLVRMCVELAKSLKDNENIPEWAQEKIAQAKGMVVSVSDYIISQHEMGHQPEVPGFEPELAESAYKKALAENASAGACSAGSIGTVIGELGGQTKDIMRRQKAYTNQRTPGGTVKIKKAK